MSNKNSLRFLVVILSAAFATAALVLGDVGVRAQNSNSSTTTPEAGAENTNTAAPRRGRRRGRRRTPATTATPTDATTTDATTTDTGATGGTGAGTGAGTGEAAAAGGQDDAGTGDLSGERVDLSGTYTGNLSTAGGHEIGSGPATLTITGTSFTLTTEGGATHTGRFYAVLTRGATSAALYFADIQDPATRTPVVYNVRARKSGDRLTLSPAPQTQAKLTFAPARGRR